MGSLTSSSRPRSARPGGLRWLDGGGWRPLPVDAETLLGLEPDTGSETVATAAYERLAAAGVSYHF
jgi:hypothetical protein